MARRGIAWQSETPVAEEVALRYAEINAVAVAIIEVF